MTITEYEYDARRQRRQRVRLRQARRNAHRWKVAALVLAVLLILSALAPLALCKEEPAAAPPAEEGPVTTVTTIQEIAAALPAEEDCPLYHLEAISFYPVPLDHDLQAHIIRTCHEYGIDPALVMAVIQKESTFDAAAVGNSGDSAGLMQVQERWHSERMERLGVSDLLDPYQNTLVGIDYLAELLTKYPVSDALTAYNSGSPGESVYADTVLKNLSVLEDSQ